MTKGQPPNPALHANPIPFCFRCYRKYMIQIGGRPGKTRQGAESNAFASDRSHMPHLETLLVTCIHPVHTNHHLCATPTLPPPIEGHSPHEPCAETNAALW